MFLKLLRIYSYLFATCASLAYLALGTVSKISATPLSMDSMPWKADELLYWLFGLGLLGLISVFAAVTGSRLRILLPIFMAIQLYLTFKGNFMGAHSFDGADDFRQTLAVTLGSLVAFLASLMQLRARRAKVAPTTKAAGK